MPNARQTSSPPTPESFGGLDPALYQELRAHAERCLRQRFGRAHAGLTLQPTALVNETLLRIIQGTRRPASPECHFALATTVMGRVLVDYIRRRIALKRGAKRTRIEFDPDVHGSMPADQHSVDDLEELLTAVERLAKLDARTGDVARMRLVWGLSMPQIAEGLQVSHATVERSWRFARAWLQRELSPGTK